MELRTPLKPIGEPARPSPKRWVLVFTGIGILILILAIVAFFAYRNAFSAPEKNAESERFIIALNSNDKEIIERLWSEGFVKSARAFRFALNWNQGAVKPGAYKISKAMNAWEIAKIFEGSPYMKWVVIPEGLRKEEIAEILRQELGWSEDETRNWITKDTTARANYIEGVYFPDTYLIPTDEASSDVARRLQTKFDEKFATAAKEALTQNIRWPTLLKIASIVQREAAGKTDMPIIAGVLWNRLLKDIKLEVDATVQYARGNTGNGWWAPIKPADKNIDSPYNTYKYKGLPPHPIANPGLDAMNAVLFPEETDCFYYLHDDLGIIHCAKTFEEHKKNIETYLR
ncbi:MAG: Aminodeoxychorismate lyase [Candidatus Giovannonibacteria bacterium GW2011_GWA2_45_21]|uniref:Endolytic murein transglycosylase n=2 Tax=Parcubacteria group TaxID=1794811 RepID=A0A0G1M6Y7_9BACT|nr:MAG: Aminodeoxychorismate lyase [Candidatus Giovannonibacteria bacterium GW2011_GWA2_45_21]